MRHYLLISAVMTLPFATAVAEEQTTPPEEGASQTETTYEQTGAETTSTGDESTPEAIYERDTQTGQDSSTSGVSYEQQSDLSGEASMTGSDRTTGTASTTQGSPAEEQTGEGAGQRSSTMSNTQEVSTQQDATSQQGQSSMQQQGSMQAGMESQGEPEIARAQFASDVQEREPVDDVSEVSSEQSPVYFFTEVENGSGETITHRWTRDGEVIAEVPLEVGSDKWRTWSSKELTPDMEGELRVEVVDSGGNVLEEASITVEGGTQMQNVGFQQGQSESQSQQSQDSQQQDQQSQDSQQQDTGGDW